MGKLILQRGPQAVSLRSLLVSENTHVSFSGNIAGGDLFERKKIYLYVLPLTITGMIISAYHNLLYYKFIPDLAPCINGISCTTKQV